MNRAFSQALLVLVLIVLAAADPRPSAPVRLNLRDVRYRYSSLELPPHFTTPAGNTDNTPADNPMTDDGATLGRMLFYDTRLSANKTKSCASCHVQAHAFSDPKPFSTGFQGAKTDRRAMPLVNLRYYKRARFFWDERAGNLEEMVLLPIRSRIEMGQDLDTLVGLLSRDTVYPGLFERAFGTREITAMRIGRALAQFVRSMVSYQSRYDEGRAHAASAREDFQNFTRPENRGKALFMRNCASCHMKQGNEHFFVPTPANTGLRGDSPWADGGVGDVTLRAADLGSFKSPSLRNVEVTAPYGHDGRFATLDALIDHYSENAILDPNLGYVVPVGPLKFTASEKAALIAFLKTLTDWKFLNDPKFSNPFVRSRKEGTPRPFQTGSTNRAVAAAAGSSRLPREASPEALHRLQPVPLPSFNPARVFNRIMSFDRDADGRITKDELPERMQALIAPHDRNDDGVLTADEIRASVESRLQVPPGGSPRFAVAGGVVTSGAAFAALDEGLPGVISDLKLPRSKREQALKIVQGQPSVPNINDPASADVYSRLRQLLDEDEYRNFEAAARRLTFRRAVAGGIVGGIVR